MWLHTNYSYNYSFTPPHPFCSWYLMFRLKLLQRLLDDRKSTVEVIKREGEKIAATAEPADKVKILKQLSLLDSRWEALLNKAETR